MNRQTFVIVGGGFAGAEAAKTLRSEGFDGRVVLVGAEASEPYERPPLSKDYLRGESPREKMLVQEREAYERDKIELLTSVRATELRSAERTVVLDDGGRLEFDRLLLATGSSANRPPIPGIDMAGVHLLRTVDDADRLREAAANAGSAVVAGGGWIAAEVAASLRVLGLDVTLAVPGAEVLEKNLGREVGGIYSSLHRRHGVRIVTGSRISSILGPVRASGVELANGERSTGDLVVLGLGAAPNVDLAAAAGLPVDDGIPVDEYLETSTPGVFAAGDVASHLHPRYGTRVRSEHWDNARRQGRAAARNMLGRREAYDRVPYFFSDQFEHGMEYLGRATGDEDIVVRRQSGDGNEDTFLAFWLSRGTIVAGMHGNTWDAKKPIDHLVAAGARIDPAQLADPAVALSDLAAAVGSSAS